jgi:hypothetical protein
MEYEEEIQIPELTINEIYILDGFGVKDLIKRMTLKN